MGLDNGVYMITNVTIPESLRENVDWMDFYCEKNEETGEIEYIYELCYWRKCWGIRDRILNSLVDFDGVAHDEVWKYYTSDMKFLDIMTEANYHFLNPENWDDHTSQIWEWHEYAPQLTRNMIGIEWAKELIKAWMNGDLDEEMKGAKPYWKFHFVDSY